MASSHRLVLFQHPFSSPPVCPLPTRLPRRPLPYTHRQPPFCCRFSTSSTQPTTPSSPVAFDPSVRCLDILRTHDHAAVLQIPFWPADSRPAFVALRAFNAELSLIPDSISSGKTLIGQMRYQWWRDAIYSCYDHEAHSQAESRTSAVNHPVVGLLRSVIRRHRLSKYHFSRIIDAREQHYLRPQLGTIDALVGHAQASVFGLLSLLFQALGSPAPSTVPLQTIDHALSHLANAVSIATLLHLLPYFARKRGVSVVPSELMECSEEELLRLAAGRLTDSTVADKVRGSTLSLATLAATELAACRDALIGSSHDFEKHRALLREGRLQRISLDRTLMPVFLAATPARTYLDRLEAVRFDAFHPKLQRRDWKLPFQIWYDAKFSKV